MQEIHERLDALSCATAHVQLTCATTHVQNAIETCDRCMRARIDMQYRYIEYRSLLQKSPTKETYMWNIDMQYRYMHRHRHRHC